MTDTVAMECPACAALMELLLTLASSEWDGGSVSWMPLEEGAPGARGGYEPTEVQLGRWSRRNVFASSRRRGTSAPHGPPVGPHGAARDHGWPSF